MDFLFREGLFARAMYVSFREGFCVPPPKVWSHGNLRLFTSQGLKKGKSSKQNTDKLLSSLFKGIHRMGRTTTTKPPIVHRFWFAAAVFQVLKESQGSSAPSILATHDAKAGKGCTFVVWLSEREMAEKLVINKFLTNNQLTYCWWTKSCTAWYV